MVQMTIYNINVIRIAQMLDTGLYDYMIKLNVFGYQCSCHKVVKENLRTFYHVFLTLLILYSTSTN